jgi:multidrug resistance efflux pump
MIRKVLLPLAAVALFFFALLHVLRAQQTGPKPVPPVTPSQSPFGSAVAGAGLIEPQTENISVGAYFPGVVTQVRVKVGDSVRKGDVLFRLDDRQLQAELRMRRANVAAAETQLERLRAMPRPEEVPPSEAKVREARANLIDQEDQHRRTEVLSSQGAVGAEERVRRAQAFRMAREQLVRAEAEYKLLKAGAWQPDLKVAETAVNTALAQLEQTQTDLKRLEVTALVDGEVLQVNVRPGEFVGAPPGQALVVLGNVSQLHVRVDVDEHDIPRFRPGAPARAMLRGDPRHEFPLRFVRVEPYVIPKKSLTGDNTERVDTRVLQVIYAVENSARKLYVGQQVDVYINLDPLDAAHPSSQQIARGAQ